MDAAIIVALIALVGAIGNVGLSYVLSVRSQRQQNVQKADATWARYRTSLSAAADELSSRIANLTDGALLDAYAKGERREEAILSSLFRFAQFFGWSEILRRYMRDPDPRHIEEAQRLSDLQSRVGRAFNTDSYGSGGFMMWREAQRAVGELMILRDGEVIDTIGVAAFMDDLDKFQRWLSRMEHMLRSGSPFDWDAGERARLAELRAGLDALSSAT